MNTLEANNLRSAVKMMGLIQNLIIDLKSFETVSDNPELQELNELLKRRKMIDLQIELNNFRRFCQSCNVNLNELNL